MAFLWLVAVILALGILALAVYGGFAVFNLFRSQDRKRVIRPFAKSRVSLVTETARRLGAEAMVDPSAHPLLFLRSKSPRPAYGLILFPADVDPESPYVVRFEAPIQGGRFVEVWPVGSLHPPTRVSMASSGIPMGEPGFDGAYIVRSDDAALARSIVTPDFRHTFDQLRMVGGQGRVRLELDGYKLRIQKEEMLDSPDALVQLAGVCERILGGVRDSIESQSAVQFYDSPKPRTKPVCPICSSEIASGRVDCQGCRTPHHRDCWEYNGRCSLFACGERQFSL